MKGIILAGGKGTRLYPSTFALSKQLLPVYDKPMIYYPLSVLMLSGIREVLVISSSDYLPFYERILGDGSRVGIQVQYLPQDQPNGIAEAFLIGESFVGNDDVCLVLGDNLFFGRGFSAILQSCVDYVRNTTGAVVFGYPVKDPRRYGVIRSDEDGRVVEIIEKPEQPPSRFAVTGLYFYPRDVVEKAKRTRPSARGELEITDVNNAFIADRRLKVEILGRGFAWLDMGSHAAMLEASKFVEIIEKRQGLKIGCIEEIAYRSGFIQADELRALAETFENEYGDYLTGLLNDA